jgi:glycosyltransferase involved in cell wall biosynthesis
LDDEAFAADTMKIVFVEDQVFDYAVNAPSATGGAERYAWLLLRALAEHHWAVTVGVYDRLAANEKMRIDGVEFVGLTKGHVTQVWYKFLRNEKPDWWLLQTANHWWGPAVEIAKFLGVRTAYSAMHDLDFRLRQALSLRPRLWPLYAWSLMRVNKIFVQHSLQLAQLPLAWRSKASVLPGVVTPAQNAPAHAERVPYVAWVAMLRQHKRPDLLMEIARRLPAIRFVVCGGVTRHRSPAGYSEKMASAIQSVPNIKYLGQVAPEKSLQIIRGAAVLLSTSDSEGFPSTFLEAWTNGTPVISVTIDPDQLLRNGGLGVLSGSTQQAAMDIRKLIDRIDLREQIGAYAQEYIVKRHAPAAVSSIFSQSLYDSMGDRCSNDLHET